MRRRTRRAIDNLKTLGASEAAAIAEVLEDSFEDDATAAESLRAFIEYAKEALDDMKEPHDNSVAR